MSGPETKMTTASIQRPPTTPPTNENLTAANRTKIMQTIKRLEQCSNDLLERSISKHRKEFLEMEEKLLKERLEKLKEEYIKCFNEE